MGYQISKGIKKSDLSSWLKIAAEKYNLFSDGRVDYTHADIAPIVMCTIVHEDKILLLKRGYGLADAEGKWSVATGFIDEDKPVEKIVAKEISEELGLEVNEGHIKVGNSYTLASDQEKRNYIVFPCLLVLDSKPAIILDREHTDYKWVKFEDIANFDVTDDFIYGVDQALKLNKQVRQGHP